MVASHLYLSTETNKSTGAKLRTKLYIYTRVERALRARIGPWALVGPSLGPSPGPWGLPWALRGPCGDRALSGPQQIRKIILRSAHHMSEVT